MIARRLAIFIIVGGATFSHAVADETKAPAAEVESVIIHAYGNANPACLEWSDGCTTCAKSEVAAPACSTPGIACQPAEIQCKKNAQ